MYRVHVGRGEHGEVQGNAVGALDQVIVFLFCVFQTQLTHLVDGKEDQNTSPSALCRLCIKGFSRSVLMFEDEST